MATEGLDYIWNMLLWILSSGDKIRGAYTEKHNKMEKDSLGGPELDPESRIGLSRLRLDLCSLRAQTEPGIPEGRSSYSAVAQVRGFLQRCGT